MIKVVCVATKNIFYLDWLKESCTKNSIELVILGDGEKWESYFTKIKLLYKYILNQDENEIICFVDAYDVLMIKDKQTLLDRYLQFERSNPNKVCVSHQIRVMFDCLSIPNFEEQCRERFNSPSYDNCLNGGGLIGRCSILRNIYHDILYLDEYKDMKDDEESLTRYNVLNPGVFHIDLERLFFDAILDPFTDNSYYPTDACFIHKTGSARMLNLIENYGYTVTNEDRKRIYKEEIENGIMEKFLYHIPNLNLFKMMGGLFDFSKFIHVNPPTILLSHFMKYNNIVSIKANLLYNSNYQDNIHDFKFVDNANLKNESSGILLLSSHYFVSLNLRAIRTFIDTYAIIFANDTSNKFDDIITNHKNINLYGLTKQYRSMVKRESIKLLKSGKNVLLFPTGGKNRFGQKIEVKPGMIKEAFNNKIKICTINVLSDKESSDFDDLLFCIFQMTSRQYTVVTNNIIDPSLYPSYEIFYDYVCRSINKNMKMIDNNIDD